MKPIWLACVRDVPYCSKGKHTQLWVVTSVQISKDAYFGCTDLLIHSLYIAVLLCCSSQSTQSHSEIKKDKSKVTVSKCSPVYWSAYEEIGVCKAHLFFQSSVDWSRWTILISLLKSEVRWCQLVLHDICENGISADCILPWADIKNKTTTTTNTIEEIKYTNQETKKNPKQTKETKTNQQTGWSWEKEVDRNELERMNNINSMHKAVRLQWQ